MSREVKSSLVGDFENELAQISNNALQKINSKAQSIVSKATEALNENKAEVSLLVKQYLKEHTREIVSNFKEEVNKLLKSLGGEIQKQLVVSDQKFLQLRQTEQQFQETLVALEKKALIQMELNKVMSQNFESAIYAYDAQVKQISVNLETTATAQNEQLSRTFNEKAAMRNIETSKASIQLLLEQMKLLSEQLSAIQKKNDEEKLLISKIDIELSTKKLKASDKEEFNQVKNRVVAAIQANNVEHKKLFMEWKTLELKLKTLIATLEASKETIDISVSKASIEEVSRTVGLI